MTQRDDRAYVEWMRRAGRPSHPAKYACRTPCNAEESRSVGFAES